MRSGRAGLVIPSTRDLRLALKQPSPPGSIGISHAPAKAAYAMIGIFFFLGDLQAYFFRLWGASNPTSISTLSFPAVRRNVK
jgi:hypothetical protein